MLYIWGQNNSGKDLCFITAFKDSEERLAQMFCEGRNWKIKCYGINMNLVIHRGNR